MPLMPGAEDTLQEYVTLRRKQTGRQDRHKTEKIEEDGNHEEEAYYVNHDKGIKE